MGENFVQSKIFGPVNFFLIFTHIILLWGGGDWGCGAVVMSLTHNLKVLGSIPGPEVHSAFPTVTVSSRIRTLNRRPNCPSLTCCPGSPCRRSCPRIVQWHLVGTSKAMRSDTLTPHLTDCLLEFLAWFSL